MGLEKLLTRLEVTSQGELYFAFRGMGGLYIPWKHLFPTRILGKRDDEKSEQTVKKILRQINFNPDLKEYSTRLKSKYWNVLQIFCPTNVKEKLPNAFIKGHYTQQARWRMTTAGRMVTIDEEVVQALETKTRLEERIADLKSNLGSRKFNTLQRNGEGQGYYEMKDILDTITKMNNGFENLKIKYVVKDKSSLKTEVKVYADKTYAERILQNSRSMTVDELMNLKWMFVDIEIPFFKDDHPNINPEISWVGVKFIQGKNESSYIYSLYDLGVPNVEGYTICPGIDETMIVDALQRKVIEENPDIISAYNARFDLIKLRESIAGFKIGEGKSNPLYKVTTSFFERIGVKDRLVIDPMNWQKIARRYDINAKLELAAKFDKIISYDDMELNEQILRMIMLNSTGDSHLSLINGDEHLPLSEEAGQEYAREIGIETATYLAGDVDELAKLTKLEEFRNNMEDALWIADFFNIGLERILHLPNTINEAQEKSHFIEEGVYQDSTPAHFRTKKRRVLEQSGREYFTKKVVMKGFNFKGKKGLTKDVVKAYIPIGEILRPLVLQNFPQASEFYHYRDTKTSDKKRLFFIEQYSKALARWMMTEYGLFVKDLNALERKLGVSVDEFEGMYKEFERLAKVKNLYKESDESIEKLYQENGHVFSDYSMNKKGKTNDEHLMQVINMRIKLDKKEKAFMGKFRLVPKQSFIVTNRRGNDTLISIDETIKREFNEIQRYLDNYGINIVAQEGEFFYLEGKTDFLWEQNSPLIPVDKIGELYLADKVYYKKNGFYSNIKLKDEPDFRFCVHEMNVIKEVLDNLLEGKYSNADKAYKKGIEKIISGKIKNEELIFFTKRRKIYSVYEDSPRDEEGEIIPELKYFQWGVKNAEPHTELMRGKEIFVDIKSFKDIKPEYEVYENRLKEKIELLLEPVQNMFNP